jgi:hypothetical protein
MHSLLTSPRISLAKHFITSSGRDEREYVLGLQSKLDDCVVHLFHDLSKMGEKLKEAGMPAGEKTRISAYENALYSAYLNLKTIKTFRTPGKMHFRRFMIRYVICIMSI